MSPWMALPAWFDANKRAEKAEAERGYDVNPTFKRRVEQRASAEEEVLGRHLYPDEYEAIRRAVEAAEATGQEGT